MKIIEGDILEVVKPGSKSVIGHQLSLTGAHDAGLAAQIRDTYPIAKVKYKIYLEQLEMGDCLWISIVEQGLAIACLIGQKSVGVGLQTNYDALRLSLSRLRQIAAANETGREEYQIYLPYGLACGLAGGDWNIVSKIIEQETPDAILVQYKG